MIRPSTFPLLSCATALLLSACTGEASRSEDAPPAACDPGPAPIRRLTKREYVTTVQDLLRLKTNVGADFTKDPSTRGFDNNATSQTVSENQAEQYLKAAETLSDEADLRALAPCSASTPNDDCARSFVSDFGRRAYRRPLEDAERDRLFNVFKAGSAGGFDSGLRSVIQVALQSPAFLYRAELDAPKESPKFNPSYAMASRLSYFFWGTMPDDDLLRAAASGELETAAGVKTQAQRLLADPRAKELVAAFHEQWLVLEELDVSQKGGSYASTWTSLKKALHDETRAYADAIFWEEKRASRYLDAEYTFVNKELASHYKLPAPSGTGFAKTSLPANRKGLLSQGAFLAATSHSTSTSPTLRGKFVRQVLLCQDLPPPPAGVPTSVPELTPEATTRERFAAHQNNPMCSGCHRMMDPIGLGLENLDAAGAWRDTEANRPVDASGELVNAGAASGAFTGPVELANKLSSSDSFSQCYVRQWFRFAHGRLESDRDQCTLDKLDARFKASGGDTLDLLLALAESDTFLYRGPSTEALP